MHKDATRQARTFNGCSRKKKERWVNVRCDNKFLCDRSEGDSWLVCVWFFEESGTGMRRDRG
jgi:hypothetical protein